MLADDEPAATRLLAAFDEDGFNFQAAVAEMPGAIDAARILLDRPDVLAAFYSEYFGPLNDRNSHAWIDRVGGTTPEDYARYWYDAHGRNEGYVQEAAPAAASGGEAVAYAGRTTYDGVPIAQILADRPDVFQAFFTEYYGAGNDRHSSAWVERVGGTTVEDYADYWYRAHGKAGGYVPSSANVPATPEEPAASEPPPVDPEAPVDDPVGVDDPLIPDPEAPLVADPPAWEYARPLVVTEVDGQLMVTPATDAEIAAMRSLFDDLVF